MYSVANNEGGGICTDAYSIYPVAELVEYLITAKLKRKSHWIQEKHFCYTISSKEYGIVVFWNGI